MKNPYTTNYFRTLPLISLLTKWCENHGKNFSSLSTPSSIGDVCYLTSRWLRHRSSGATTQFEPACSFSVELRDLGQCGNECAFRSSRRAPSLARALLRTCLSLRARSLLRCRR